MRLLDTPFGYPTDGLWLLAALTVANIQAERGISNRECGLWNIADRMVRALDAADTHADEIADALAGHP